MRKPCRPIPAGELTKVFSPARKARIAARAAVLTAEEMALRDIRRTRRVTQEQVALRLDAKQAQVSRLEARADVKLSTLRDYVRAIGGELQLTVTFPEGGVVAIRDIGMRGTISVAHGGKWGKGRGAA